MKTFMADPNLTVRFNPPIGTIKHIQFDNKGEFTTDNERIIQRFMSHFDSKPAEQYKCKKCDYVTNNKGELMVHHRKDHPKGTKK
jgi:hypothetical protein